MKKFERSFLLNPHGSDETTRVCVKHNKNYYFLTHTVQMKLSTNTTDFVYFFNFLTHTVQMKQSEEAEGSLRD